MRELFSGLKADLDVTDRKTRKLMTMYGMNTSTVECQQTLSTEVRGRKRVT